MTCTSLVTNDWLPRSHQFPTCHHQVTNICPVKFEGISSKTSRKAPSASSSNHNLRGCDSVILSVRGSEKMHKRRGNKMIPGVVCDRSNHCACLHLISVFSKVAASIPLCHTLRRPQGSQALRSALAVLYLPKGKNKHIHKNNGKKSKWLGPTWIHFLTSQLASPPQGSRI